MKGCNCKSGPQNTGIPSCVDVLNRTSYEIYMYKRANDGTYNSIKDSDLVGGILPTSFITAKINETDESKRWYVMPKVKNVTFEQADPNTEDIDGIPYPVSEGIITGTVDYVSRDASPQWYGVLKSFECLDVAKYEVTVSGELIGVEYDNEFRPMPMEQGTMWLKFQRPTKTAVGKIMQTVVWKEDFPVERINAIAADKFEDGALDSLNGLQDIVLSETDGATQTATNFYVDANLIYGGFEDKQTVEGLTDSDFTLYNETTPGSVAIDSVTEDSEGKYDIDFTTASVGSAQTIRVQVVKEGFYSEYITITTP